MSPVRPQIRSILRPHSTNQFSPLSEPWCSDPEGEFDLGEMSDDSEEMERDIGILYNYAVEEGFLVKSCTEEHLLIPSPRNMTVPSRNVSIRTSIEIGKIESPVGTSPDGAAAEIETLEEMIGEEVGAMPYRHSAHSGF